MKITHEGKEYSLNVTKAIEAGFLKPALPLNVGDVYVSLGNHGPQLLVQAIWGNRTDRNAKLYVLLGIGCSPNSNSFFHELSSLDEIEAYLNEKGLVFQKNIHKDVGVMAGTIVY